MDGRFDTAVAARRIAAIAVSIMIAVIAVAGLATQGRKAAADTTSGNGWHYEEGTGTLVIDGALSSWMWDEGGYYNGTPPWYGLHSQIRHVKILPGAKTQNCNRMFDDMGYLENIDGLSNLDMSAAISMRSMFGNCEALTSLDFSGLDTRRITNMNDMFNGCTQLTNLNVSGLNTSSVTAMHHMFANCRALESLDVSNFDTRNVTTMSNMFYYCKALTSLNLSHFNTGQVTHMENMFFGCDALTSLNVSSFNTENVTSMFSMFDGCNALTNLDLSSFNTRNVKTMAYMFLNCWALETVLMPNFDTGNVIDMAFMFGGCHVLTSLDVSRFNTEKVINMWGMFELCYELQALDLSQWRTPSAVYMNDMFWKCEKLETVRLDHFDTSHVRNLSGMFRDCCSIEELDVSMFDVSSAQVGDWWYHLPGLDDVGYHSISYACGGMFDGMSSCKKFKLGPKFAFTGFLTVDGEPAPERTHMLPKPPTNERYVGKWTSNVENPSGSPQYAPEELRDAYGASLAGTYVWAEKPIPYTVVFQDRDGNAIGEPQTVLSGSSATAPTPPVVDGWHFVGWDKDFTHVHSDLVVRAQYQKNAHVVTYHANGHGSFGEGHADTMTQQKPSGESIRIGGTGIAAEQVHQTHAIGLDACGGVLPGGSSGQLAIEDVTTYVLTSWNTAADGSGTAFAEGASYDADEDLVLHAQWAPHVESLSEPLPAATREGYALDGWYDSETDGQRIGGAGERITTTADMLYARWNQVPEPENMPAPVPSSAPPASPAPVAAAPQVERPKPASASMPPLIQTGDGVVVALTFLSAAAIGLIAIVARRRRM